VQEYSLQVAIWYRFPVAVLLFRSRKFRIKIQYSLSHLLINNWFGYDIMGYRYRDEIIASILDSATKEEEGVRMTKVCTLHF
jgi:hypothetical protein